jgi:hypothetical protein
MKKKMILRIAAGISAALLIGIVLFITNAFVGNPISAKLAGKAAKNYIKDKYSFLDLEVEKPVYNFKESGYVVRVKSKSSVDTHFSVHYRNGRVKYDDYDYSVANMFNTLGRFSDEYSAVAKSILANRLGYVNNTTMVTYGKGAYENTGSILKLDMKFDKSLPLDSEVMIRMDLSDNSISNIAKILTDAHRVFVENGCKFSKYQLFSETKDTSVMVTGVTPGDIESGKLETLLENANNNEGAGEMNVYIKGSLKNK